MVNQSTRNTFKRALAWSRVKLMYNRITLTKWTTAYFFLALIYCIVLAALQGVAYADNAQARTVISGVVEYTNMTGLVVDVHNHLEWCTGLPNVPGTNCTVISPDIDAQRALSRRAESLIEMAELMTQEPQYASSGPQSSALVDSDGKLTGVDFDGAVLSVSCANSLHWLNDTLRDAVREDITILVFHFWLFALALVTILNESLPHLVTGVAGHALVTAWAAFRVGNSKTVERMYDVMIVRGTCSTNNGPGEDILGDWWQMKQGHELPILILNVASLVLLSLLSLKLYKVYARQSFERVGASDSTSQVHILYKLVLVLSSLLQLAGFFVLASTVMWIDKASMGNISLLADHLTVYRVALIVMVILVIPWLILGWQSVRKEQRRLFWVFFLISLLFLGVASSCFGSHLYRFIFSVWPLFATMTIASYILIVAITVMGVVCRCLFGKGMKEFLEQTETPEGADFAPVYIASFPSTPDDDEKGKMDFSDSTFRSTDLLNIARPPPTYQDSSPRPTYAGGRGDVEARPAYLDKSFYDYNPPQDGDPSPLARSGSMRTMRTSVFNDPMRDTVKLSTTPPVAREGILARVEPEAGLPKTQLRKLPQRKESVRKLTIGLPSNPRKGGSPIETGGGGYF
ncbi:hypothetical protein PM082_019245 [Marasmius tenuissimus]|nr:hypothetical protein PM082_019245 [Marasmius tenuissimus]